MIRDEVIRAYKNVRDKSFLSYNAVEFAGMYLFKYPGDPMAKLLADINDMKVPKVLGEEAKTILYTILRSERKEEY